MSRSLAKDGKEVYGNLTKVKATKNKMSPPYRTAEFNIVYGVGIDRVGEVLDLLNEYKLGRKYGDTYTFDDVKYNLDEFKQMILDDEELFTKLKNKLVSAIKGSPIKGSPKDDVVIEKKNDVVIQVDKPQSRTELLQASTPKTLTADLFDNNEE